MHLLLPKKFYKQVKVDLFGQLLSILSNDVCHLPLLALVLSIQNSPVPVFLCLSLSIQRSLGNFTKSNDLKLERSGSVPLCA